MICFVDYRTTDEECDNLHNLGLKIIKIPKAPALYDDLCTTFPVFSIILLSH